MAITSIRVRGARQHNLKNSDVAIPRNTLTVITGLSGSGKSSLAFDTIYAEGQRRYVETLSPYARQFLDQMERPDVDSIDGLSPAISIEQKTTNRSPRSTVGTITEIYDYLRVLYASIGVPHCPNCGHEIARQTSEQILEQVLAVGPQERVMILAPIVRGRKGEYKKELDKLSRQGFVRARVDGVLRSLDEEITLDRRKNHTIEVVVDRLLIKPEVEKRLAASIETAMKVVVDPARPLLDGGLGPGGGSSYMAHALNALAGRLKIPIHKPFADLPRKAQTALFEGADGLPGVLGILDRYYRDENASETYR